jgi:Tol biopolymer transport system component
MPKHFILLTVYLAALVFGTPTPPPSEREKRLAGCLELGVAPQQNPNRYDWEYTLASPDGTYIAEGHHLGSHGCHDLVIYQCVEQRMSPTIGCQGIFPPESQDVIFADAWVSDSELRVLRPGKTEVLDARTYFDDTARWPHPPDKQVGVSPDGQWIILKSWRDGMPELYREHPDGTGAQRLTRSLGDETFYGWSPDGAWLIWGYTDVWKIHPYRMRVDGTGMAPLFHATSEWDTLGISPHSRWLLMEHDEEQKGKGVFYSVFYRLSVTDGTLTRLTDPTTTSWFKGWSPDGRALIYSLVRLNNTLIYELVDLNTGGITRLIQGNFPEFRGWSADQSAAIFTLPSENRMRWYQVNLDGTNLKEIKPPSP